MFDATNAVVGAGSSLASCAGAPSNVILHVEVVVVVVEDVSLDFLRKLPEAGNNEDAGGLVEGDTTTATTLLASTINASGIGGRRCGFGGRAARCSSSSSSSIFGGTRLEVAASLAMSWWRNAGHVWPPAQQNRRSFMLTHVPLTACIAGRTHHGRQHAGKAKDASIDSERGCVGRWITKDPKRYPVGCFLRRKERRSTGKFLKTDAVSEK